LAARKNKTGPTGPRKTLDEKDFAKLVQLIRIQCTQDEICAIFDMSPDTLGRRISERGEGKFADLLKKHAHEGKASLRRAQWKSATEKLNPTMLIWLGKNQLGQRDEIDDYSPGVPPALAVTFEVAAPIAEIKITRGKDAAATN